MLTSMLIDNFRGFRRLEVPVLPQITLLTGTNGSGKSTLLEAAFALTARNAPGWILNLQAHRGFARVSPTKGPRYTGLFYGFKDEGRASISGAAPDGSTYRIELERASALPPDLVVSAATADTLTPSSDLVVRAFRDNLLENESTLAWVVDKDGKAALQMRGSRPPQAPAILLHPGAKEAVDEEEVERFGSAKAAGRAQAILEGLQMLHPSIEDIEFLRTPTGEAFYARRAGSYIPLGLLGGGVNNVFRYLTSLSYARGGFLGMDEVENGIHYTALPTVFRTLVQLCFESGTQLLMSTHSRDAVVALSGVAQEYMPPSRSRIGAIHLSRGGENNVRLTWFVGDEFTSSVELGYEVR